MFHTGDMFRAEHLCIHNCTYYCIRIIASKCSGQWELERPPEVRLKMSVWTDIRGRVPPGFPPPLKSGGEKWEASRLSPDFAPRNGLFPGFHSGFPLGTDRQRGNVAILDLSVRSKQYDNL